MTVPWCHIILSYYKISNVRYCVRIYFHYFTIMCCSNIQPDYFTDTDKLVLAVLLYCLNKVRGTEQNSYQVPHSVFVYYSTFFVQVVTYFYSFLYVNAHTFPAYQNNVSSKSLTLLSSLHVVWLLSPHRAELYLLSTATAKH